MTFLEKAFLHQNKIKDISSFNRFKVLTVCDLNDNYIESIDVFSKYSFDYLNTLKLSNNYVKSIKPLTKLKALKYLESRGNQITSVDELVNMTSLNSIDLFFFFF